MVVSAQPTGSVGAVLFTTVTTNAVRTGTGQKRRLWRFAQCLLFTDAVDPNSTLQDEVHHVVVFRLVLALQPPGEMDQTGATCSL